MSTHDAVRPDTREANPYSPEIAAEPVPFYAALREHCPVASLAGIEGAHIISRYEDVKFALRHPEIFSSDLVAVDIGQDRPLIPLQIDPPEHAKYRRLMDPQLGPKEIAPLEADTRKLVNEIIDGFVGPRVVRLPCRVLGTGAVHRVPPAEWAPARRDRPVHGVEGQHHPSRGPVRRHGRGPEIRRSTGKAMYAYFGDVIDDRVANPGDDVISRFVHGLVEDRAMSRDEILDICYLFILGGLDTVTSTLDCSIAYLAQRPEHRQALVDRPELMPHAVEELLRLHTPVMQVLRVVAQEHEMHGVTMKPGDTVMVMLGAADTDPDGVR